MKAIFTLLAALLIFATSAAFLNAGQPVFKVLAVKGEVKMSKSDRGPWETLTLKSQLTEEHRLKLNENNYVGLVHNSGRTTELNKSGTFKVAELVKNITKKELNITKRLTSYLIKEIGQAEDMLKSDNYRKDMEITGSVERSIEVRNDYTDNTEAMKLMLDTNPIKLVSPRKANVINSSINVKWAETPGVKSYKFCLNDRFDREVFSKVVTTTQIEIDLKELNLEKDVYYFWTVYDNENLLAKSDDCAFLILSEPQELQIKNELETIGHEIGRDDSPMAKLIYAAYYDEHSLYFDAMKYYDAAINQAPDVDDYQKLYKMFQSRINSLY